MESRPIILAQLYEDTPFNIALSAQLPRISASEVTLGGESEVTSGGKSAPAQAWGIDPKKLLALIDPLD